MLLHFVIASLFKNPLHKKGKINFQAQPLALFMDITKKHRSHLISGVNKLIFNQEITVSHNIYIYIFFFWGGCVRVFTEPNFSHIVAYLHLSII